MGKAAAERVTYSEKCAHHFFYYGYEKEKGAEMPTGYPQRIAWVHRWPNVQWSSEKLIDFTGALFDGTSFVCEVKEWDSQLSDHRFKFSRISKAQHSFMDRHPGAGWLWLGVVVPSKDRRKINHRMFLIPWEKWLEMEESHYRKFKDGGEKLWRSISLEWIVYYFGSFELAEVKHKWWTQEEIAFANRTNQPLVAFHMPMDIGTEIHMPGASR